MASVSMRGSLFNSGGMVGSVYVMVFGAKCILTCVSSNLVLYGVSFVVHSSSGIVRMVMVSWFSCAASLAQYMAFCRFWEFLYVVLEIILKEWVVEEILI
jgi:hypothetical protein